jgi:hypothetical protein
LTLISPPPPMIFIAASDMPCHDALLLTMFRLFSDAFSMPLPTFSAAMPPPPFSRYAPRHFTLPLMPFSIYFRHFHYATAMLF